MLGTVFKGKLYIMKNIAHLGGKGSKINRLKLVSFLGGGSRYLSVRSQDSGSAQKARKNTDKTKTSNLIPGRISWGVKRQHQPTSTLLAKL